MLWREKKLGDISHIVARKIPSLTNRGAPMNTSNWFLNKIKITDSKLNHVHLRYKLHNTQTSETITLSQTVNQLTSHFLKPGNRCWKLSHCKSKIKSGLTNSLYNKAFQFLFVKKQSWPKSKLLVKNQKPKSSLKSNYTEIKIQGDSGSA